MSRLVTGNRYRINRERYNTYIDSYRCNITIIDSIKPIIVIIGERFIPAYARPIGLACYHIDYQDRNKIYNHLPEDCFISDRKDKLNRVLDA
jgi:hypothetical protein